VASRRADRRLMLALALGLILACALLTRRQVGHWRASMTVFQHALDVTEDNYMAHGYVGTEHARAGNVEKALEHYHRSLEIRPHHHYVHYNMANLLMR